MRHFKAFFLPRYLNPSVSARSGRSTSGFNVAFVCFKLSRETTLAEPTMKLSSALSLVGAAATALGKTPHHHREHDDSGMASAAGHHIPSSYESAVMGRRILALTKLATFSTVFPLSASSSSTSRRSSHTYSHTTADSGTDGLPIGLVDYIADCETAGNPTILELKIGTTFRNVRAGSNITVSLQWTPPYPPAKRIGVFKQYALSWLPSFLRGHYHGDAAASPRNSADADLPDTVPYSADNLARFALFGYLEPFGADDEAQSEALKACYTAKHPDSRYWLPGNKIHTSQWTRMVVTKVYWVGGFGDRAYIGWIPVEEWNRVTEEEWRAIKLPGETQGWSEWNAYDDNEEL